MSRMVEGTHPVRRVVARFVGDPVGYRFVYPPMGLPKWVRAEVGVSGRFVEVNLGLAYMLEDEE